jgi:hypothetical protein
MLGGVEGYHPYRPLLPPITMLQDVMREDIAPWDERNKNNHHQHGFDVFCRGVADVTSTYSPEARRFLSHLDDDLAFRTSMFDVGHRLFG